MTKTIIDALEVGDIYRTWNNIIFVVVYKSSYKMLVQLLYGSGTNYEVQRETNLSEQLVDKFDETEAMFMKLVQ